MTKSWYLAVLLAAALTAAHAQNVEVTPVAGWARMGKSGLGYTSLVQGKDQDTTFRNGYFYGLRLTFNDRNYFGHEFTLLQTQAQVRTVRQDTDTDPRTTEIGRVRLYQLSYNFLAYWMPKKSRLRPYWTVGLEGRRSGKPRIADWPTGAVKNYGFNYGAGLKLTLFSHAILRLDARDTWTGKPYKLTVVSDVTGGGLLRQMQGSIGIGFAF